MASEIEIWVDVNGFEGYYQVSNFGRIRTVGRMVNCSKGQKWCKEKIRKPGQCKRKSGRIDLNITLSKDNIKSVESLPRLVAKAFHPNPENKPQVNHKDGNTLNNLADNLEWATSLENMQHAAANGLLNLHWTGKKYKDHPKSVKVIQLDNNKNEIKEWDSATQAANELKVHRQCIVHCLKGRQKTAFGFVWQYKNVV